MRLRIASALPSGSCESSEARLAISFGHSDQRNVWNCGDRNHSDLDSVDFAKSRLPASIPKANWFRRSHGCFDLYLTDVQPPLGYKSPKSPTAHLFVIQSSRTKTGLAIGCWCSEPQCELVLGPGASTQSAQGRNHRCVVRLGIPSEEKLSTTTSYCLPWSRALTVYIVVCSRGKHQTWRSEAYLCWGLFLEPGKGCDKELFGP